MFAVTYALGLYTLLCMQPVAATGEDTCLGSGYPQGSCCDNGGYDCISTDESCHCDALCYYVGDCCEDIKDLGCLANTCIGSGFGSTSGCCDADEQDCSAQDGSCYCDQACFENDDCCEDIKEIGCHATELGENTCLGSGFDEGSCCVTSVESNCSSIDVSCFCDAVCYENGDCCEDIEDLGCFPPVLETDTCLGSGYEEGSCCDIQVSNCTSIDESCYCDVACYANDDCCEDIEELGCFSPVPDENTCLGSGFEEGACCDPYTATSCASINGSCYCDVTCFEYGDCCEDIEELECFPPVLETDTCLGSGYEEGSCCDIQVSNCTSIDESCYCDVACYENDDCCEDIEEMGCFSPVPDENTCLGSGLEEGACCDPYTATSGCASINGSCYCDVTCFEYGDCCEDIEELGCFPPVLETDTCLGSGYEEGSCCDIQVSNCTSIDESCYCDVACYENDDCCEDIEEMGCFPPVSDENTCLGSGFEEGACCDPYTASSCASINGSCYCDVTCFEYGDCCEDIEELGCFPPVLETDTCLGSGYEEGSCCDTQVSNCTSIDESCYCDAACYENDDCCEDIEELGCFSPVPDENTCLGSGFEEGACCDPYTATSCASITGSCYCDVTCFEYNDCCEDIEDIGCFPPVLETDTCLGSGYAEGSCCDTQVSNCTSIDESCYCDAACYENNDCCEDIEESGCFPPVLETDTCLGSGYEEGSCCDIQVSNCTSIDESCYCDVACYANDDCCEDIEELGCLSNTCLGSGYMECCDFDVSSCSSMDGSCKCDSLCGIYNDCCDDAYMLC